MKGDQLQFVQLKEEKSEPKATAFLTHAQRKAMKKQKKVKIVPKAAQQMLKKDTKLTFNQELVQIKPFKVNSSYFFNLHSLIVVSVLKHVQARGVVLSRGCL